MAGSGLGELLRHRTLSAVWLSQVASNSGDFVFLVAIQWYVLASTRSVLLVGIAVAAALLPNILVAPLAGVLVDRHNRRNVLLASYAVQGAVVAAGAALFQTGHLSYVAVVVLIVALEVGHQFTTPSNSALLAVALPKEDLVAANGILESSGSANQLGSSALGGLLLAFFGLALPLTYDAVSFVVGFLLIATVPRRIGVTAPGPHGAVPSRLRRWWLELRDGGRFVRRQRLFLELAIVGVVVSFFPMGLQGLWAPYVGKVLSGTSATFGFFEASFAVGTLAGGLLMLGPARRAPAGRVLFSGLMGQAAAIAALGFVRLWWAAFVLMAVVGVSQAGVSVVGQAIQQARIPAPMFGRVSTLLSTTYNAPAPLFIVVTSAIAAATSVSTTVEVYGLAFVVCVLVAFFLAAELREAEVAPSGAAR